MLLSALSEAWESEKKLMVAGNPMLSLIQILAMWIANSSHW